MFHEEEESINDNGVPMDLSLLYETTRIDARWATKAGGFFCATDPSLSQTEPSVGETTKEASVISLQSDGIFCDKANKPQHPPPYLIEAQEVPTSAQIPKAMKMEDSPNHYYKAVLDEILLCPLQKCMNRHTLLGICCVFLIFGLIGTSWAHARSKRFQDEYRIVKDRVQSMIDIEINDGPFDKAIEWIASEDYIYQKMALSDSELLQRVSMAAAYFATSEDTWKLCGRRSTECKSPTAQWLGSFHECLWDGVQCDYFDRVTDIDWKANGEIAGEFPTSISYLRELTSLDLQDSQIMGAIPNLKLFDRLRILRLGNNTLSGELPTTLTQSTVLEDIDLSFNKIQGTLTSSTMFASQRLYGLNLQGNHFHGRLQDVIHRLTDNIRELTIQDNHLSGSVPRTVGRLSNLQVLSIGGNSLMGSIPTELGFLTNLSHFSIADGLGTSQSFPTVLYHLTELKYLNARGCKLTGRLSDSGVSNWTQLQVLDLAYNKLTGTIPPILAKRPNDWEGIDVQGNVLNGSLSREFCPLFQKDLLKASCTTGRLICPSCNYNP